MENFYTSLSPLCKFARMMGFFPIALDKQTEKGHVKVTICGSIQTAFVVVIVISILTFSFFNVIQVHNISSDYFLSVLWAWLLVLIYLTILIQILYQLYQLKDVKTFFRHMHRIDTKFFIIRHNFNHIQHHKVIRFWIIFAIGANLSRYIASLVVHVLLDGINISSIAIETFFSLFALYETFMTLQLMVPAYQIRERFRIQKNILINSKSNFNFGTFAEIFHDLCDGLQMVNKLYTIHLIPIMLYMIIIDIFGIYATLRSAVFFHRFSELYIVSTYALLHFLLKCSVAHMGSSTTHEAEEVISTVAKIINKISMNDPSRYNFYNLLRQFQTRNLKVRALFMTIDWNIVLTVSNHKNISMVID